MFASYSNNKYKLNSKKTFFFQFIAPEVQRNIHSINKIHGTYSNPACRTGIFTFILKFVSELLVEFPTFSDTFNSQQSHLKTGRDLKPTFKNAEKDECVYAHIYTYIYLSYLILKIYLIIVWSTIMFLNHINAREVKVNKNNHITSNSLQLLFNFLSQVYIFLI